MFEHKTLKQEDPKVYRAIKQEQKRQECHIELIASENYVSKAVLEAQGSILTNKYAEGYPGKRYYGGCEHVDVIETLAIERAKELFNAGFANVQPHSGSTANAAVYLALLSPGDKVLAMDLVAGGHLTHGCPVNFSGKYFDFIPYGVDEQTGLIDYDHVRALALEYKPKLLVCGFSAYSRIIDWKKMGEIAAEVGAYSMADMAHVAGLVAAGVYPSPIDHVDVVTTTTHKTLRGPRSGLILGRENKEMEKKINSAVFPGTQGGPLEHVIAAKAIAFQEALMPDFVVYQKNVVANARLLADTLIERGYKIVSSGTDNHLLLVDLSETQHTGKEAEAILAQANITVNKNTVPGETRSPFITSGIRMGTAAMTTRGFSSQETKVLAHLIADMLDNPGDKAVCERVKQTVDELTTQFPVYQSKQAIVNSCM